jgi:hypothetical protein
LKCWLLPREGLGSRSDAYSVARDHAALKIMSGDQHCLALQRDLTLKHAWQHQLHALPSLLMADDDQREPTPKTQQTQPKGIDPKTGKPYKPIEIPVPKRGCVRPTTTSGGEHAAQGVAPRGYPHRNRSRRAQRSALANERRALRPR